VKKTSTDARAAYLLKRARARAGLNQTEVAARAGLPQSTVSAYESGRRQPTLPMLSKLLEAMGAELALTTPPLPDHLTALTGPVGLRVRRHRQLIVEQASGHGVENLRVLGAAAKGEDGPADELELLVDTTPKGTVTNLLTLTAELEEIVGVRVKILTREEITESRQTSAEQDGVIL
jgi:uncharacterized protein